MCINTKNKKKVFLHAKPADCDGCMEQIWSQNNNAGFWNLTIIIKEEACMKYLNATSVLPDTLVKELQNQVQGGYIYIPIEQEQQKRWGEASGYRQELEQRNQQIKREYRNGVSIECLTEKYCLSLYTVRKIIYQK